MFLSLVIRFTFNSNQTTGAINAGPLNFFDRFSIVTALFTFLITFALGPTILLNNAGAPGAIVLLFGAIWIVLWILALASFGWRKDF